MTAASNQNRTIPHLNHCNQHYSLHFTHLNVVNNDAIYKYYLLVGRVQTKLC